MSSPASLATRYCCFLVGDNCFAVASDSIAEVLRDGRITRVPHAAEAVLGLLHLRGRIVPVIDMRRRLGFAASPPEAGRTHVVVPLNGEFYSFLVDEMLDVVEVAEDRIEHPAAAADPPRDAVTGVYAAPGRLVHFLDPQRIVNGLEKRRDQVLHRQGASHGGT